jgi:hypothetical protein
MTTSLASITEQYCHKYQEHAPELSTLTLKPHPNSLKSNPSGLTIGLVRQLSSLISAKAPLTPPAGARGATCDLLDAQFAGLDVDTV